MPTVIAGITCVGADSWCASVTADIACAHHKSFSMMMTAFCAIQVGFFFGELLEQRLWEIDISDDDIVYVKIKPK